MKLLIGLIIATAAFAQSWPTTGLVAQWYGTSGGGITGSTLTDLSGNGHNGTINGTTQTAKGTTCNGSSDYISYPPQLGNGDFTAFFFVNAPSVNYVGGVTFAETSASPPPYIRAGFGAEGGGSVTGLYNAGFAQGSDFTAFGGVPAYGNSWHAYYLQRAGATLTYGVLDQNIYWTTSIGNITSLPTLYGTLCAQATSASTYNAYWAGTLGPMALYTKFQTSTDLQVDYAAGRAQLLANGAFVPDLVSPLFPSGIWQRQGEVLAPSGGAANQKVLYTKTDCVSVANPCLQMWVDFSTNLTYLESKDGRSWTNVSNVLSESLCGAGCQPSILKLTDGTYLMMVTHVEDSSLDAYKSASAVPNVFTLLQSAAITASALKQANVFNSSLALLNGTIYLATDGGANSGGVQCGAATSTTGSTWTPNAVNPVADSFGADCQGPDLHYINNEWYMWTASWNDNPPRVFRNQSATFNTVWGTSSPTAGGSADFPLPTFQGHAPDESNQVNNPTLVDLSGPTLCPLSPGGCTYMYYSADGGGSTDLKIKLAVANMPISQIVTTGEGMISDVP